ncbi:MAG: 3-isopropylmalate dehydratase small subunit [Curvibacter lanceolatus]|jgi:3-isopropylmalate/(R)-2-methylmalate dehydratase small subunit|uniref:3-isopropylmalate dehydratase small subunit n=1 Tax=Curvibacter lanceolatus TaxID=86182 RepID=UPI0023572050|nr:3-isopropylmalate dehydratase small subunit [Curvibacter lanceolatus]MBV5291436.1 3-isopropylmalate dehydratase small subunit [Curvibacter lanceolatus]
MQPFVAMQGVAAPMPKINVDTDAIIAVQHVYTLSKVGLGRYLFHRWRYADDGSEKPDFVLNRAPFRCANVLVARANFGCGSSREHAVWALADFGIRVVIAPSFASIFYENCVKNGVLPLTLQEDRVEDLLVLLEHGADRVVAVDLQKMQVKFPDGSVHAFDINDAWRETLLKGLDPVSVAASHEDQIAAYQDRDRMTRPWVWSRSPNTKKETA